MIGMETRFYELDFFKIKNCQVNLDLKSLSRPFENQQTIQRLLGMNFVGEGND